MPTRIAPNKTLEPYLTEVRELAEDHGIDVDNLAEITIGDLESDGISRTIVFGCYERDRKGRVKSDADGKRPLVVFTGQPLQYQELPEWWARVAKPARMPALTPVGEQ